MAVIYTMQWTRCNHRHALSRDYEWFWQGNRSLRQAKDIFETDLPAVEATVYQLTVRRLREMYGESETWVDNPTPRSNWDAKTRVRNAHWWIDTARRRLWVRDSARIMLALTG